MPKIAIFASGAGSNASQITNYFKQQNNNIKVDCFVTNKANAGIYKVAEQFNLPIFKFSNGEFEEANGLIEFLRERKVNWIVLAGFLRKIPLGLIEAFEGKMINLHPSLLPKYGGKGMYGKYVHEAVIKNEEKESGITIHLVNQNFDEGKILFQKSYKLSKEDTAASLAEKIQELEHECFPLVIEQQILRHTLAV